MMDKLKKLIDKYQTFIKYIIVAFLSFIIDITIFTFFNHILDFNKKIIVATIIARLISSFINFLLNRNKVFKSSEGKLKTAIKYYSLVVIQMLVSAFIVDSLHNILKVDATFIKIPVEIVLFICNYLIQKILIFKRGKNEKIKG